MIDVAALSSPRDREAFLRFPWRIYRDLPAWVPPVLSMQRKEIDPARGWFFNDGFGSKAEFFLARRRGEVAGRIAAIRNERHLARHRDGVGFFGFFECLDDPDVAGALLARAGEWLEGEGLSAARGPTSFTLNDPSGVLVRGWGIRPSAGIGYTPAYYAELLEGAGFHKARDLLVYHAASDDLAASLFQFESLLADPAFAGIEARTMRADRIEEEAELFARVFSESWDRNWGAFPFVAGDLVRAHREMGPFFDPELGGLATVRGNAAGIFLAAPDPWEIFHRLGGRLGLRGLWRILRDRKKLERIRVFLFAVLPEFRQFPIGPYLIKMIRERRHLHPSVKTFEFSWILEDNLPIRRLVEAIGAKPVQALRIYEKLIGG